jgi:cytoskeletal protein RodZ
MSSILDALEKAHRKRRKAGTGLAPEDLAEAERRERMLHAESVRHRRLFILLVVGISLLAILLILTIASLVYLALVSRADGPPSPAPAVVEALPAASVSVPESTPPPAAVPTPTAAPEVVPEVAVAATPLPTASPTPTPESTPVPNPVETPAPTPQPPVATPTSQPTPQPTQVSEGPRFAHMQVVYDEELGINIRGILADGPSSVIMIDNTTVALGRKYGKIRPIRIENRMIEAEYDQDGEEITLFIRW